MTQRFHTLVVLAPEQHAPDLLFPAYQNVREHPDASVVLPQRPPHLRYARHVHESVQRLVERRIWRVAGVVATPAGTAASAAVPEHAQEDGEDAGVEYRVRRDRRRVPVVRREATEKIIFLLVAVLPPRRRRCDDALGLLAGDRARRELPGPGEVLERSEAPSRGLGKGTVGFVVTVTEGEGRRRSSSSRVVVVPRRRLPAPHGVSISNVQLVFQEGVQER